jgi:hypothetical protein
MVSRAIAQVGGEIDPVETGVERRAKLDREFFGFERACVSISGKRGRNIEYEREIDASADAVVVDNAR